MQAIVRIIDQINKVIMLLIGLFAILMSIVIIFQVFSRYVLDYSLTWSEELARYLMVWSIFLGAALALRKKSLIAVEVISENLPYQVRRVLKIVVYVICLFFFILLLLKGIEMVGMVKMQRSPALQVPMSIPYAGIPIGATALILNAIAVILELISGDTSQQEEDRLPQPGEGGV